ncbi:hypothetical protein [Bacillus mycoides]|uniref:hypothetical protein n=1 Tax=Bacillus mycoides TaxID=1405 RepID=UPI003A7FEA19
MVQIYAPFGGRPLGKLQVTEVLDNNVLVGTIVGTDIVTAYYLSDGIRAEVLTED